MDYVWRTKRMAERSRFLGGLAGADVAAASCAALVLELAALGIRADVVKRGTYVVRTGSVSPFEDLKRGVSQVAPLGDLLSWGRW